MKTLHATAPLATLLSFAMFAVPALADEPAPATPPPAAVVETPALPPPGAPVPPGYIVIEAGPPPPVTVIEAPAPEPPPEEAPPPPPVRKTRFSPSIDAGYGYQTMFSIPSNGIDVQAIVAADDPRVSLRYGGAFGAAFSTTDGGLHTTTTNVGPYFEGHAGRFRFGGGVRIGTFNVTRATDGTSILSLSAGVYCRSTFDLILFDKEGAGALYVALKASVDGVGTSLYGLNASLGARF